MNSARNIDVEITVENAQPITEELSTGEASASAGRGAVMWFNPKFGIGYVRPDGGGPNLYVTSHDLAEGCRSLTRGRRVDYVVAQTEHRAHAIAVREIQ